MPLSGTIARQVSFRRATSGSIRMTGIASGITGIAKAVAGVLQLTSGIVARKATFKRSLAGTMIMSGVGQRVYAKFKRAVAGNLYMSATLSGVVGAARAVAGILQLTSGLLARKVSFKRSTDGSFFASGVAVIVGSKRFRSLTSNLYFVGRTAVATGAAMKRGLSRLGFSPKDE